MDDEILQEFLAESWENLSQLDTEIVALEKEPANRDLIAGIFRTIHTIKGTCGFIGLVRMGSVAHATENVLGRMRSGELVVTPGAISLILEAVDVIKTLLASLEATGKETENKNADLIARLESCAAGEAIPPVAKVTPAQHRRPSPAVPEVAATFVPPRQAIAPENEIAVEPVVAKLQIVESQNIESPNVETQPVESANNTVATASSNVADLTIRVNVNLLDSLMNLVGELVLTRNQLLQLLRNDEESKYAAPIAHLNRVTTDLQEGVMKTRMQPIGNAWSKLPRLVRDLSQVTGKAIELDMQGAETELDRTVLDAIRDPLTHMVRNSADHGIEACELRRAAGKSASGTIRLSACHEAGHVVISLEDDGAGIDAEKVLNKAIQNGLVSPAQATQMSSNDKLRLIFNAGLSTAQQVSSVSGRGVGMDVVKTQIEKIGGTVDLASTSGQGTSVRIKIPLTLAIISALVVESRGQSFAIPQLGVVELVRLTATDQKKLETIHNRQVLRLRNRLLPLVHLDDVLGLNSENSDNSESDAQQAEIGQSENSQPPASEHQAIDLHRGDVHLVVVQVGEEQMGLVVDEVFDTEEIVVKPMGRLLKQIPLYQGTTILGDGRVIMILDVAGIAARFGGLNDCSDNDLSGDRDAATQEHERDGQEDLTSLLLFAASDDSTMAVPLSLVARLEEFSRDQIEQSAAGQVVQYRGDLLPLQPVQQLGHEVTLCDPQPVIVFSEGEKSMGLMVHGIQDILDQRLVIRTHSKKTGVLGTAIVNGVATDVIDTQHYIIKANPEWFTRTEHRMARRLLVVDDSLFFRQLVTTALESEGYEVRAVESAARAIEVLEQGERFAALVSDIEMPEMDGCALAQWVRGRADLAGLPLLALTSLAGSFQEQRILQAGFDCWLKKFNARQLIETIDEILQSQVQPGEEIA